MALDPGVADILKGELAAGIRESARLTGLADRNLSQGLGVINNTLIQQHGSAADDAATMAALRTSIHVPQPNSAA